MDKDNAVQIFEDKKIRTAWDEEQEEWYFSIVDVVSVLTESKDASAYWRKLKQRLKEEGNETVTNCHGLKMVAADGKRRMTDVANLEQLFRIIQSIPSPKAEPLKMWLAEVGRERVEETIDPELTIERALETYAKKGYTREWINQRLQAIQVRKELTDEWKDRGVQAGIEFAILTDEITRAWSGMTTRQYKRLKGLTKENLRDNMTTTELVLNMLAETSTTDISKVEKPETFAENQKVAKRGGKIAGIARQALEAETGKAVITSRNAAELNSVVVDMIEGVAEVSEQSKQEVEVPDSVDTEENNKN
ncbi:BRO family protein [Massilioclostridium coli]|uniref:BRO family protein n=1 Tax=Massilioclostridium coli TaxID=1870991 RepID=UPI00085BE094|nr:BRO family protein [Massilioclostridium coli]